MPFSTVDQCRTIAAIATAPGRGGIGVVRVSGAGLAGFAQALCGREPRPRVACFTAFLDADPADYPIGVTYGGDIFWHEKGFTADGGALSGFLESGDQYLNSAQDRLLVRGMVPDFQDQQGAINLSIITRDEAQGPETTRGPYALTPSTQRKDFFVEARLARVRYDFNSAPAYWRGGKPTFDVVKTGQW